MRRARVNPGWWRRQLAAAPGLAIAGIFIGISGLVSVTSWYAVGEASGNGLIFAAVAIGAEAFADLGIPLFWRRAQFLGRVLVIGFFALCLAYKLEAAKHFSAERLGARDAAMTKAGESYELAAQRVEQLRKAVAANADARSVAIIQGEIDQHLLTPGTEGCPAGQAWNGPVTKKVCPDVARLRIELARAKERDQAQADLKGAIEDWRKATPVAAKAAAESIGPVALLLALIGISVTSWSALMSTLFMTVVEAGAILVPVLNGLADGDGRKPAPAGDVSSPASGQETSARPPSTGDGTPPHTLPQGVTERTRRDIADATAFLAATSERVPGERVQASKLYGEYQKQRGEQAMTPAQFGVVLSKHLGLAKVKSEGKNWYVGLRLRHPAQGRKGAKHLQAVAA